MLLLTKVTVSFALACRCKRYCTEIIKSFQEVFLEEQVYRFPLFLELNSR